jgi:hypothetical protein
MNPDSRSELQFNFLLLIRLQPAQFPHVLQNLAALGCAGLRQTFRQWMGRHRQFLFQEIPAASSPSIS